MSALSLLSHPFRVQPDGTVAAVEQGSPEFNIEQLAMYIMTIVGERRLVPGFGLRDPVFGDFDEGEIATGISFYGPPDISLQSVNIKQTDSDGRIEVQIQADV